MNVYWFLSLKVFWYKKVSETLMQASKMLKFFIWLISHLHLGTFHMLQSKFQVASEVVRYIDDGREKWICTVLTHNCVELIGQRVILFIIMIYDYRRYYNVELNGIGSLSTLFNPLLKSSICFLAFASCFICNFPPFLFSFRCAVRRYCNADIKYYFF